MRMDGRTVQEHASPVSRGEPGIVVFGHSMQLQYANEQARRLLSKCEDHRVAEERPSPRDRQVGGTDQRTGFDPARRLFPLPGRDSENGSHNPRVISPPGVWDAGLFVWNTMTNYDRH
jgi:hypothetical protein